MITAKVVLRGKLVVTRTLSTALPLVVTSFILAGCNPDEDVSSNSEVDKPDLKVEFLDFGTKSYGSPYVEVRLTWRGDHDIYNLGCDVRAYDNDGSIIDTGLAYAASGSTIQPNQIVLEEAVFTSLDSLDPIDQVDAECSWLDR